MRIVGGHTVDMHYMPMEYLQNYTTILKVFFKHLVFLEVAVATVHVCLENKNQTQVNYTLHPDLLFIMVRCEIRQKDFDISDLILFIQLKRTDLFFFTNCVVVSVPYFL